MVAALAAEYQGSLSPGHPHTNTALLSGTVLLGSLHFCGISGCMGDQSWWQQTALLHTCWGLEETTQPRGWVRSEPAWVVAAPKSISKLWFRWKEPKAPWFHSRGTRLLLARYLHRNLPEMTN